MPETVTLLPWSLSYAASGSIGMVGCWAALGIEMAQAITAHMAAAFMRNIGALRLLTRGDPEHEAQSAISRSNWRLKFDGDGCGAATYGHFPVKAVAPSVDPNSLRGTMMSSWSLARVVVGC